MLDSLLNMPSYFVFNSLYCDNLPYKLEDKRLTVEDYYPCGFVLDFPGYRGPGLQPTSDNGTQIECSIGENVELVLYTIVPATDTPLTDEDFAAIAAGIFGRSSQTVYSATPNEDNPSTVSLPYEVDSPAWMVIVPVDNTGEPFDFKVAPLAYTDVVENVTMNEVLLSFAYESGEEPFFDTITGLTLHRAVSLTKTVYTFSNPYVNELGWYQYAHVFHKETPDWQFVHEHGEDADNIYFVECDPGVCVYEFFGEEDAFLKPVFDSAYKEGDKYYFHVNYINVYGQGDYSTQDDVYYVIDLNPNGDTTSVAGVEVADENAPVEYYDLQGRRVLNPSNGFYIRRQGSSVTKMLIK